MTLEDLGPSFDSNLTISSNLNTVENPHNSVLFSNQSPGIKGTEEPRVSLASLPGLHASTQKTEIYEENDRGADIAAMLKILNIPIARRWMFVHTSFITALLVLTLTGSFLLNKCLPDESLENTVMGMKFRSVKNALIGITYICSVLGLGTVGIGTHFFWKVKRLGHPYAAFTTLRSLTILLLLVNFIGIFIVSFAMTIEWNKMKGSANEKKALKAVYGIILFIHFAECAVSFTFVSGSRMTQVFKKYSLCGKCCVYRETQGLSKRKPADIGLS